jgi:NADPH:quinone reductase-like Zn-dependent oxidoreductase
MKAAVVSAFDSPPRYQEFPVPVPVEEDQIVVDVLAAGLHPRVRSQADGSHYTSTDELPLVPGVDGVGRDADGRLRYFVLPDTAMGSMAEHTVIDTRRSVVLPDGTDPIAVAAGMNPAMSSWIALRRRIAFQPGQDLLVLGATGNAGQLAVQVAALLGAKQIIAAGRNQQQLASVTALGATHTAALDTVGEAAAEVDVVIDYLWGEPAATAMASLITARPDRSRPLTWIQIGSIAGPTAGIPSAALRAARLQIVGSGQGSVTTKEILTELPALAEHITSGSFQVDAQPVPLADVEQAWTQAAHTRQRLVLVP